MKTAKAKRSKSCLRDPSGNASLTVWIEGSIYLSMV